jgi:hypothetical protein
MAKLINGNGNPAIYAWEDADLIASLAGNVTCIANVGNKYAATEEDANTIGLADGVIITKEGRRIQLDAGETDLFAIPTGSSGVTNYYIIGYKLVQNADSTQVAETFVQKMSSSSETITEDTFRGGATEVYVSLYRVTQVGFDITAVDGLLPAFLDNAAIKDDIAQINSDFSKLTTWVQESNPFEINESMASLTSSVNYSELTCDLVLTFNNGGNISANSQTYLGKLVSGVRPMHDQIVPIKFKHNDSYYAGVANINHAGTIFITSPEGATAGTAEIAIACNYRIK